jgi:hypothetical protein
MALGRKTGGRRAGTPNKPKSPTERQQVKQRIAEAQEAAADRAEAIVNGLMPLEYMLQVMRDEENPPGFRMEAAKAAAQYCHAKMAEAPSDKVSQITEIRRIIIAPREVEIDEQGNGRLINEGEYSNGEPLEPVASDPAEYKAAADEARAKRDALAPPAPDPVAAARSRLDKMRGIH